MPDNTTFRRQTPLGAGLLTLVLLLGALLLAGCTAVTLPSLTELANRNPGYETAAVWYIHGAGNDAAFWAKPLADKRGGLAYDWKEAAADRLAAPAAGYDLGLSLAKTMTPGMARTLYAHSAGAWLAQGIADGLALRTGSTPPTIIFLDPFTARSLFDWGAGKAMLGKNTAHTETYFTTRDGVPFTTGDVAVGDSTNIDDLLDPSIQGTPAHWAVIDWYFANKAPPTTAASASSP